MLSDLMLSQIAQTVYEAVRVWNAANNLDELPAWKKAGSGTQDLLIARVKSILSDPRAVDGTYHNAWVADMQKDGWSKGDVEDETRKIHPLIVPFSHLPHPIKARERLIRAITISLSHV